MTEKQTNFRPGMKYKYMIWFLGVFVGKRERQIWVRGWGQIFAEFWLGQGRQSFWCFKVSEMDRSDWRGAKESKRVSRILLKQMKTWKFKQIQRQSITVMDSTLITHLFKFRRRNLKIIHIILDKLTITQRSTPSKHKATWIPNSVAKPWSFLCQNAEMNAR